MPPSRESPIRQHQRCLVQPSHVPLINRLVRGTVVTPLGQVRVSDMFGQDRSVALQTLDRLMVDILVIPTCTDGTGKIDLHQWKPLNLIPYAVAMKG